MAGLHDPRGIARLVDGRVVVIEPGGGTVLAIDLDSGARTVLARGLPISIERQDLPGNTPLGVAVGRDGAIYVSCGGRQQYRQDHPVGFVTTAPSHGPSGLWCFNNTDVRLVDGGALNSARCANFI